MFSRLLIALATVNALVTAYSTTNYDKNLSVNFRAMGIGVSNRTKATAWYIQTLGITKIMTMSLASTLQFPWDEDICSFPKYDKRGSQVCLQSIWTNLWQLIYRTTVGVDGMERKTATSSQRSSD
jgi:hypothetical protein